MICLHLLWDSKWLDRGISSILGCSGSRWGVCVNWTLCFWSISITPVKITDSCQSEFMQIIPILDTVDWIYPRDRVSKAHRLCWNYSVNELAGWKGQLLTHCSLASPMLRAVTGNAAEIWQYRNIPHRYVAASYKDWWEAQMVVFLETII